MATYMPVFQEDLINTVSCCFSYILYNVATHNTPRHAQKQCTREAQKRGKIFKFGANKFQAGQATICSYYIGVTQQTALFGVGTSVY